MPLFDPPKAFLNDLHRYDPTLRCRWSDARACFLIERKVSRGKQFPPPKFVDPTDPDGMMTVEDAEEYNREVYDEWKAASDGYIIEMNVDAECLDNRVFLELWNKDIWRRGGADAVNDQIDQALAQRFRESRAAFNDRNRQEAKAAYRYMNRVRTVPESGAHTAPVGGMSIMGGT